MAENDTPLAKPRDASLAQIGAARFEPPASADERYETGTKIATGGMGEVRACRDLHLGRDVAMKLLKDEHTPDRAMLASFLREARVQAQLEHPAIVPVYDMGVRGGVPFLTMKRIRGTTLADVLERDTWSTRRLLAAFGAVCQAVDYAHARGIVHRDLKPSNVMLGDFGEVYVLDWGVAKILGDPEEPMIAGTPKYMAPEQHRGDTTAIDARTDVYALGAVLREIVTGEEDVPELLAICERATAERREDRYASPGELFGAVDGFLAGEQDVERRRALSQEHAAAAVAASDRTLAMREVGRALALDPENVGALRTLVRLMGEVPAEIPPEVEKSLERTVESQIDDLAPMQIGAYASFVVLFPLVLWMGVRDWRIALVTSTLLIATPVTALVSRRAKHGGRVVLFPALVVSTTVIMLVASMFGPFVFVPALAAINTLFYVIQLGRGRARIAIGLGCLPIIVPSALEQLGVAPAAYRFEGGAMTVLPWMHELRAPQAPLFLFLASVGTVVLASVLALRFRESLTRAELRVQLQAWQLRKMLPPEAEAAGTIETS
jgi:serine/threonine-protein kinase